MKVVRSSATRTGRIYPQEMFLVLIFTRGFVDSMDMVRSEEKLLLKIPVTQPAIDPGTVRLVAQRLNHYPTPGPIWIMYIMQIFRTGAVLCSLFKFAILRKWGLFQRSITALHFAPYGTAWQCKFNFRNIHGYRLTLIWYNNNNNNNHQCYIIKILI